MKELFFFVLESCIVEEIRLRFYTGKKEFMESIKHKMQGLIRDKEEAVERAIQLEAEKQEKEDLAKEVELTCNLNACKFARILQSKYLKNKISFVMVRNFGGNDE